MVQLSQVQSEFEHNKVEDARNAALEAATSTGGRVFPCTVSRQGGRLVVSAMLPLITASRHVTFQSAEKGGDSRGKMNRPLMGEHVKTIYNYLVTNRHQYILPPLTLNVIQIPQVHVARANTAIRSGYLVIDDATKFAVTDGQHRMAAIAGYYVGTKYIPGVLKDYPDDFGQDGIVVQIVVEPDIERVHQDFADAAQTKPIPASLLAVYNTREPINRVLNRTVSGSPLLNGRVDETSKTLPKFSQHLFLLNQIRALTKELLIADYAMSDESLSRNAAQRIGTQISQEAFIRQALQLIEVLTEHMEPWKHIVKLSRAGGEANQIPDFRLEYLNMTATGLVIIGRVAFEINKNPSESARLAKYTDLATKIDWRRKADFWKGTVVTTDEKIVTNRGPVSSAAEKVKAALGLPTKTTQEVLL